ncbi:SDR family oxidoreductase [Rhodomicrobium vannielii ATCC 17100]|uniref:SDR family oxidoreductase n=1 Tax=Rhodomicrobium vannielii TaxID=1069 RepID=UPI00191B18BF|nr:SDR family oxidoreductase [Rhodomicrobium vannielii]MBJ7532987.1 SDR family oxidoreductase [Rhodomicrobium vannielii ATCC 17100]
MIYFVTGASGFIGKRLVKALLSRTDATVYFLMRSPDPARADGLRKYWGVTAKRAIAVQGDLLKPDLGVSAKDARALKGKVDHVFHLAAVYDLDADAEIEMRTNIEGTRNAVRFAETIGARHFHHMSSIAAAGLYEGTFREDMFEEARGLEHPYYASKHESEGVVRRECSVPWRLYRPGIVVGDSKTGEMDKIDGPYYFFGLIKKIRGAVPPWMPLVGLEGGRINIVPVDFVVAALDHIAHQPGLDGRAFHLTDPHPHRVGDVMNIFAHAGHAPDISMRINVGLLRLVPPGLKAGLSSMPVLRRLQAALRKELALPKDVFTFLNYPTRFDSSETQAILEPAGITVPRLDDYAAAIWDYWERKLDPDLMTAKTLRKKLAGKVVLITGGSSGIGKATAMKLASAGATVLIVARDPVKLDAAREEAAAKGLTLHTYAADVTHADQCDALVKQVLAEHGGVDVLINNAGRSIRRAVADSYDRMHDFERTMQVNYFGAVRLTLGLLPSMVEKGDAHIINISSIGVLTSAPRFSAYIASKAALEAWTRAAAAEYFEKGVHFTVVNFPLVRTPMISPTKIYDHAAVLTPDQAAEMLAEAILHRPARVATGLGVFGGLVGATAPRLGLLVNSVLFQLFPDTAAKGNGAAADRAPEQHLTAEQVAFSTLFPGVHV